MADPIDPPPFGYVSGSRRFRVTAFLVRPPWPKFKSRIPAAVEVRKQCGMFNV